MSTQREERESHWWRGRLGQELLWNWTPSELEWVLLSGESSGSRSLALRQKVDVAGLVLQFGVSKVPD